MKTEGTNGTSKIVTMGMTIDENNKVTGISKGNQIEFYENPSKDFEEENLEFVTIQAYDTILEEKEMNV